MRITVILFLFTLHISGQQLEKYRWQNRILLVLSSTGNSSEFEQQLVFLKDKKKELLERKLVVYTLLENEYRVQFSEKKTHSSILFLRFNKEKAAFKIILIGLDGTIKLAQKTILSTEKLFAIIDGMPIRKTEIRNHKE